MDSKPKVLFLCTGNSARSQMAEGFLRHFAGDRLVAVSAGIEPVPINPLAVEVMNEIGIDISGQRSKSVSEILKEHFALVIGVCDIAKERCPVFPFAYKSVQWSLEDPATASGSREEQLPVFRRVRDEVARNVRQFLLDESADLESGLPASPRKALAARNRSA
jgi:arsenate reductase